MTPGLSGVNKSLKVEFCNLNSISNKVDSVSTYLSLKKSVDLLFVTESWLKPEVPDAAVTPNGFNIFRNDRLSSKGGGVLLLYKKNLQIIDVRSVSSQDSLSNQNFELICIDLIIASTTVRLCCAYVPPNYSRNKDNILTVCNLIKKLSPKTEPFYVCGDFNLPSIDWKNYCSNDPSGKAFLEFCSENGFAQCIDEATHNKGNILDILLMNPAAENLLLSSSIIHQYIHHAITTWFLLILDLVVIVLK